MSARITAAELERLRAALVRERADHQATIGLADTYAGRIEALEAERHSTNEALSKAVEEVAELAPYLALGLGSVDGRVSAWCPDPEHPTWLRAPEDQRPCPWCYVTELQGVLAADAVKINGLLADRSVDLPGLRASVTGWSERCRGAESEAAALRVRVAELEARLAATPTSTWFLADYEGAEGGPKLHTTEASAKQWVADWSAGDGPWDWIEQDGVHEQWHTDPDDDRPTGRGAGSVLPLTVQGGAA